MTTSLSELLYNIGMTTMNNDYMIGHTEPLLTRREIAKHIQIAPDTVTRWTKQGLPAYYIGKVK